VPLKSLRTTAAHRLPALRVSHRVKAQPGSRAASPTADLQQEDRLEVQLSVRNAICQDTLIPITAQPDGSPASVRLSSDRRWYQTNSFSF